MSPDRLIYYQIFRNNLNLRKKVATKHVLELYNNHTPAATMWNSVIGLNWIKQKKPSTVTKKQTNPLDPTTPNKINEETRLLPTRLKCS